MKKLIILSMTMLLSVFTLTGCNEKKKIDNNSQNNNNESEKIPIFPKPVEPEIDTSIVTQTIGDITFKITELEYEDNNTLLNVSIHNDIETPTSIQEYRICFMDKENLFYVLNLKNSFILDANATTTSSMMLEDTDLTKATSIYFELAE